MKKTNNDEASDEQLAHLYQGLHQVCSAIVNSTSEDELFPRICEAVVNSGLFRLAWIGMVEDSTDQVRIVAQFGAGSEYLDSLSISTNPGSKFSRGPTGTAIREGRAVWCQDFQSDPTTEPWHERGMRFGWRSSAALPLFRDGRAVGTLTLYAHTTNAFTEQAQKLLLATARDVDQALKLFSIEILKDKALEDLKNSFKRLHRSWLQTVEMTMAITDARDPYTSGHERRVAEIAVAIANEMGLDTGTIEGIRVSGYLHDLGKIGVPAEILTRPGRLSEPEFELVKTHSERGYKILKEVDFPWPVAEVAYQHHERLDGSGYPRGLKGDEILLEARIMAVADVVESMASHRPYRAGLGIERALTEIERGRGTAYAPTVADTCMALFREKGFRIPD
ncbi:HD domain-containing phosphohydrolase [Synechococcus sp. CS-1328]|uniref:HD domain-containing phosphohydrolase n=1 Tax=Synechococcus sp. CS-1328 TaxID=2847976 RepID=UPI00223B820A|nr:HD domain-containing phosphohydrolase [Synechococcus sp. CS-1328]MCT0223973.1 GAF domain-containing protein [Synechococcus sp. CS-1328]